MSDKPCRILVIDGDRKQRRWLSQILRRVIGEPIERESLGELPDGSEYDLITVNYDLLDDEERTRLVENFSDDMAHLVLVSDGKSRPNFVKLFSSKLATNLLAYNEGLDVDEFIVTVQKLLRHDIFGIEKYFTWGVEPKLIRIASSSDKREVLARLDEYTKSIGIQARFASSFCTVADELITNAIYNAPVDEHGNSRFAHLPRTEEVTLPAGHEVELKYCCDGRTLGISASDPFGSLTQEQVLKYLAKCFRGGEDQVDQKAGGAGLGLYYVFDSLSHLIVNISPGNKTEVIGLLDVAGSYRSFANKNKSFNIFVGV